MTSATFYRRRAERFAQLLDEANGGRRHHARSRVDDELAQLVTLGHRTAALRPTVEAHIDPDFKAGLRAMLMATAERDGIGATAVHPEPQAATKAASTGALAAFAPRAEGGLSPRGRRLRARGAVLAGVAIGAIAVSGISTASEDAKPGDALYGVKRSTERAQLALASSDVNRGQLYLDFAHTRLAEVTAARPGSDLPTMLTDMDSDTRQGVKLLTTAAASRRDEGALRAIDGFLKGQRAGVAALVGKLSGADKQRAIESRTLLEDVQVRVDALRRTLACGASADANTDSLGPLPRTCGALGSAGAGSAPAVRGDKHGVTQPVERGAQRPAGGTAEKAPAAPSPSPTGTAPAARTTADETPPAGGGSRDGSGNILDQVGRALGDLLGG